MCVWTVAGETKENLMRKTPLALAAIAIAMANPAAAQNRGQADDHSRMNHGQMDHSAMGGMMQPTPANPYPPAEMEMHRKMTAAVGGDTTETWVRKMIEHHRGAIAMSQIVLRQTRDPRVRQMATKSSTQQQREIGELQAWLRQHGKRAQ